MNLQGHSQTQKPDQTKININGFDMAKIAAQLLYGPVLVFFRILTLHYKNEQKCEETFLKSLFHL